MIARIDQPFYPPIPTPREGYHVDVGDGHALWVEEIGPKSGRPIVVLHGGPGGSIQPYYRQLLNPDIDRGIYFDQRGCGRSTYTNRLANVTTQTLVEDLDRLRRHLGLERWMVLGGSWGSTLALAYAQAYPQHVAGLVVSGVFLARDCDIAWWWEGGFTLFPEIRAARDALLAPATRQNPRAAFHGLVTTSKDNSASLLAIMQAEGHLLDPAVSISTALDAQAKADLVAMGEMFMHFDAAEFFLKDNQLLNDAGRLADIPGAIIAGRHDCVTPPAGAWDLAQAWPRATLHIVALAGHRWNDPLLGQALVPAVSRVAGEAF